MKYLLLMIATLVAIIFLSMYYPVGVDWRVTYAPLGDALPHLYNVPTFTNPPHAILFLPHTLLPITVGNAVNLTISIAVLGTIAAKGGPVALLLCFTSAPFFDLARTNNIDWIPALAFLVQTPALKFVLIAVKPQVLGGATIVWMKHHGVRPLIPVGLIVLLSLALYGLWFTQTGLPDGHHVWNFSPFPLMIPFGVYLLWRGYKDSDEVVAACATPFLVPYFAPYSLAPLIALLSVRHKWAAFGVWSIFWMYFVIEVKRAG